MSTLKVGALQGISASSDAITLANDGTCTANITNKPNRNLIINGAMQVAQRGTSYTGGGYGSVDRWKIDASNLSTGSAITKSQQSLSSSDTPYTLGFRKFARMALAAAGSASATSYAEFQQKIEAQNISNSGWNYNSTSSFVTLQFWFRCSTNQTFYGWVTSTDGTNKRFTFSFTASGNNAWTKVTKTIPGASGIQIDDNNGEGFSVVIAPFYGTDYTGSVSLDTWVTKNDATHSPDYASTWLTAGASTFDLTGVQLEVSDHASDFEFRSFGQELALCQRYFERIVVDDSDIFFIGVNQFGSPGRIPLTFKVTKRAIPTVTIDNATFAYYAVQGSGSNGSASFTVNSYSTDTMGISSSGAAANTSWWVAKNADGYVDASAEL